jgi:hypothetical protein
MNNELSNQIIEICHTPQEQVSINEDWIKYCFESATSISDLKPSDKRRIALAQLMNQHHLSGRQLFHMTLTYKPFDSIKYDPNVVNKFFINFYIKSFLPFLMQTRNIHTVRMKSIQPICLAFIDEHEMKPTRVDTGTEFPLRLHHHAILAVHPDTTQRFTQLVGTNTLQNMSRSNISQFNYKLMTTDIRECDAQRLLYASKKYSKYPDFLQFPNTFQRNHCSHKRLIVKNKNDKSSNYSNS